LAATGGATRVPSVLAYGVLLALLLGLYRCTPLGLDRAPDASPCRPVDCGDVEGVGLRRASGSPGHLLVPVTLRGQGLLFLLDTGAETTVLAQTTAESLGWLDAGRLIFGAINERFGMLRVLPLERLGVAGHAFGDFDVTVLDMAGIHAGLGERVDGVLGADVLSQQPFEIDFAAPSLRLGRSRADFDRARQAAETDTVVPIERIGGGFYVTARADDREAFFLVDSGSNFSQVGETLASEVGGAFASRERVIGVDGARASGVRKLPLALLAIADVGRRNFVVAVGEPSLLGADFFAGMRLRVEAAEGALILRTRGAPAGLKAPTGSDRPPRPGHPRRFARTPNRPPP